MPRITGKKMAGNHLVSPDWCPGCGLYAFVNEGRHRDDCTAQHADDPQQRTGPPGSE